MATKRTLQMAARKLKRKLLKRTDVCRYCNSKEELTVDHVLPLSRGGKSGMKNLAVACRKCNQDKGALTHEEYLEKLRRRNRKIPVLKKKTRKIKNWLLEAA